MLMKFSESRATDQKNRKQRKQKKIREPVQQFNICVGVPEREW